MGIRMFGGFVCTAVLLGLIWLISYSQSMDTLSQDLDATTVGIQHATDQIAKQKQQIELRQQTNDLVEEVSRRAAVRDQLKREVLNAEAEGPRVAEAMMAAIQQVRAASIGLKLPTVAVGNRRVIRDAVVERITEEGVTFKHSEGIATASRDDLPDDLRDRFRLGEGAPAKPQVADVPGGQSPSVAKPTAAAAGDDPQARYQRTLNEKRLSVSDLHSNVSRLEQEVARAESELNSTESATQKYHARTRRDALKTQLDTFRRAHFAAQAELRRLEALPPPAPKITGQ